MEHANASFAIGDAQVSSNTVFGGVSVSDLIDDSYALQGSEGVDDGMDVSSDEYANVVDDFNGSSRPKGSAYDIGAIEK